MMKYVSLAVFLALVGAAGALGAYFTTPQIATWYAYLQKPAWSPPNAVFGPVWTTLYIMIAVAGWRVWQRLPEGSKISSSAMLVFACQLVFNAAWSVIFFGFHQIGWAAVDIILLLCAIAATISHFSAIDKCAAWLLLPYFMWVTFAACLNAAMLSLN